MFGVDGGIYLLCGWYCGDVMDVVIYDVYCDLCIGCFCYYCFVCLLLCFCVNGVCFRLVGVYDGIYVWSIGIDFSGEVLCGGVMWNVLVWWLVVVDGVGMYWCCYFVGDVGCNYVGIISDRVNCFVVLWWLVGNEWVYWFGNFCCVCEFFCYVDWFYLCIGIVFGYCIVYIGVGRVCFCVYWYVFLYGRWYWVGWGLDYWVGCGEDEFLLW